MFSQLFNRSTAIFRNAFGYRPTARIFATCSPLPCIVCQLRVSQLKGSVHLGHDSVNDSNNWVSVLDSRGSLLATIVPPASGSGTNSIRGMDVDPKRNLAFVFAETYTANYGGSTGTALYVIDGANNTVHSSAARTLPASQERSLYGGSVAVNPDTSRVYVPFNITTGGLATGKNYNVNGTFYLNVYSEQ